MLETVDVGSRTLRSYRGVAPDHVLDEVVQTAERMRGARALHVNATPYGGGVSELLRSLVPLLNDVGLVTDWRVIRGDERFFTVTKAIHNGLQGAPLELTEEQQSTYLQISRENAEAFTEEYDVVFMHDPQPAAILSLRGKGRARWIWRCHIDTAEPNPQVWAFLRPFLEEYDAAIFTMAEFAPPDMPTRKVEIIPPAIDPCSPKNLPLPADTARQVLEWLGVRTDRPLVTQVSRFDPWKDPLGVMKAYRKAREAVSDLQLVLAGSLALDDPEGWEVYRAIREEAGGDPRIHVLTNLVGVGNIEVNAFQALSDVVVQKSIREGFGLVVSETLWKGTPVVAGRAGGIPLQMADGVGGILVDDVEECAAALRDLLADRERARSLGAAGRDRVREHFLMPRLVLNHLRLMRDLTSGQVLVREEGWTRRHDPVCGMALGERPEAIASFRGSTTASAPRAAVSSSSISRSAMREGGSGGSDERPVMSAPNGWTGSMSRSVRRAELWLFFGLALAACSAPSRTQEPVSLEPVSADPARAGYVGAETCKGCHEEAFAKFASTRMGRLFLRQPRNTTEGLACENCHGPGKAHVAKGGGKGVGGMITFAKGDPTSAERRTAVCLSCHTKGDRLFWRGSAHESRDVACTGCHKVMQDLTPRNQLARATEIETCGACHAQKRAQQMRTSHMPLREGKMTCSSCHGAHGTVTEALLKEPSPNETCYRCHAEKRGPFLWTHPPAQESCANCHDAHGSNHESMLKVTKVRLCQQCHIETRHPTTPYGRDTGSLKFVMGRACSSCHVTIHGSNHPSGFAFTR